ncbi:MAG TPA: dihydroneopterin aldolase [Nevskiaceae bacterium]|nr:dihydroneopterin aldolase [Nevskiaceae bacterium]
MDHIFIDGLQVHSIVGVHAHEQHAPRLLLLDLQLGCDARRAAASDQLRDTIDYQAVADALAQLGRSRNFQLIETFAESAARLLFGEFPIATLELTVHKPGAVAGVQAVGVRIKRVREDYAVCGR